MTSGCVISLFQRDLPGREVLAGMSILVTSQLGSVSGSSGGE